jgi:hypothetical protein
MSVRPRVAIASSIAAECVFLADWLTSEGYEPFRVSVQGRVADELQGRALDLIVVDVAFAGPTINAMRARQPQIPIIVIGAADPVAEAQAMARGAVYLTRPVERAMFACTVTMAIMESRPSRRSQRKRARLGVVVQGLPSQIIDLSREGMRLEIPRNRRAGPPPPLFDVTVPMLGVALNVRRLWTATPPETIRDAMWYGGELLNNSKRVELAWLTLFDALPNSHTTVDVQ